MNDEYPNSKYNSIINKFIGKEVMVKDEFGERFTGTCIAINSPYLNIILDEHKTKEIIVIRNVRWVKLIEVKTQNEN